MDFKDLTPEQREKASACATTEEILALAKEEGVELSESELERISGGASWDPNQVTPEECPFCHAHGTVRPSVQIFTYDWFCEACRQKW